MQVLQTLETRKGSGSLDHLVQRQACSVQQIWQETKPEYANSLLLSLIYTTFRKPLIEENQLSSYLLEMLLGQVQRASISHVMSPPHFPRMVL